MVERVGVEVFRIEMEVGKDLVKWDMMGEGVGLKKIEWKKGVRGIEGLGRRLNL